MTSKTVTGRLAKQPFRDGDPLPAVGSQCLVSGVNCDVESDQHRTYQWRKVVGYAGAGEYKFVCLHTEGCWPTVERLENCWFAEIPTPQQVETPAPHHYAYGIVDKQNKPHFSEACVGERIDMENEAESLNDGDRRDDYRVVELLWRDSPEKAAAECTLPHDHFGACNAEKTSRKGLCREGFCSPDKPCVLPAEHHGSHEFTSVKCPSAGGYECPKGAECKC